MKSLVLLVSALLLAPVQAAPKSKIDPRGVALLDREIARLKALKSFSVAGVETVHLPGGNVTAKVRLSLQWPQRAALDVMVARAGGAQFVRGDAVLVGDKAALTSRAGAPATTEPLSPLGARQDAMYSLYNAAADTGGTSLLYAFLSLRSTENPAREDITTQVRVEPLLDGTSRLQNVTVTQQQSPNSPLDRYQYGFDSRGQLRRFAFQLSGNQNQTVDIVAHFGMPVSNWKGSQTRTDALVYAWKAVAPDVKIVPVVQPAAFVEPRARALFARSYKLYSGLRGLRLKWTVLDGKTNTTDARELRLDRAGRLFLRGDFGSFTVSVINSKTSLLYSYRLNTYIKEDVAVGARREVSNQLIEAAFRSEGTVEELMAFVGASATQDAAGDPLTVENVQGGLREGEFLSLRATVLPARRFGGEMCDLVRIVKVRSAPGAMENAPNLTRDQTFWFARSNGRLMRLQVPFALAEDGQTDAQITFQKFNPTWSAKEFTFALPKDAKPSD